MRCADFRRQLIYYQEGMMGEADRETMEEHLENCVECRAEWNETQKIVTHIRKIPKVRRSSEFWDDLYQKLLTSRIRLDVQREQVSLFRIIERYFARFLKPAAIGCVVIIICVFTYFGWDYWGNGEYTQITAFKTGSDEEFYLEEHIMSEYRNLFLQGNLPEVSAMFNLGNLGEE